MAQTAGTGISKTGWAVAALFILVALSRCLPSPDASTSAAVGTAKWVTARSLNCRSSNSVDASVVKSFGNDNVVKVLEERDGWSRLGDSTGCWVASRYLADTPSTSAPTAQTPQALLFPPTGSENSNSAPSSSSSSGSAGQFSGSSNSASSAFKSGSSSTRKASTRKKSSARKRKKKSGGGYSGSSCPCSGGSVCIGPRGGRYCITSGGNKRYGV